MEVHPVLSNITHELESIKAELSSDKITNRHKAIERLDGYLNTSKAELIEICTSNLYNIKWSDLYGIVIDAIIKQSEKLEEAKNSKGYTTLFNKNPIYSNAILKLVNYSLQGNLDKRINSTNIYQGISLLVESRTSRENFGLVSLQIIDEYFFHRSLDISKSFGELKPIDFLQLIDYIFKIIKTNQKPRKLGLRILCKVFEASTKYFQVKHQFIKYLPEVKSLTDSAIECNDYKDTVIKLNLILVRTLCIDYHKSICDYLLNGIMLQLCKLYEPHLKNQYKLDLFELFELFLIITYPKMKLNGNLETKSINTSSERKKILANLLNIVKTERTEFYKAKEVPESIDIFLEFSSSVLYITYHHQSFPTSSSSSKDDSDAATSSQLKIPRISSGLQKTIAFTSNNPAYLKFWFAILVKLLSRLPSLIKETDLQSLLQLNIDVIKSNSDCKISILNVKKLSEILLQQEIECQQKELISNDLLKNYWLKLIECIIQNNQNCEIEKNCLLQVLILYGKLNKEICKNLINSFLHDHKTLKRIDKLRILKEIFINYETNVFEADLIKKLIELLYSNEGDTLLTSESLHILAEISTTLVLNNYEKKTCTAFKSKSSIDEYKNKNILNMIQFKYLEKFIALESRLKSDNPVTSYTITNYLNECNFKILIENLNYIPIAENYESAVNGNLIKIQKIILLNLKFTKMNVANNNTEACPIKKKFSILFNQIELQLSLLEINGMDIKSLIRIFKNLLKTFQLLRFNSLKSSINQENCNNTINFIKKCATEIQTNGECGTKLQELEFASIEIFAIITSSYKNHESFSLLKNIDFSSKNSELIFEVLQYFIESDHLDYVYGEWIVDQLKSVCKKYSTNHDISMKILKLLKPAFKLLKNHEELPEYLFIILASFQKISYKMKYSEEFNENLLMLCKDIGAVYLNSIISDERIRQCYIEMGKFFNKPSLLIQFSVIECIGYLLDPKWMSCDEIILKNYIDFTQELYNTIDWKKLTNDKDNSDNFDDDEKQNVNSVLMQFFVELFAFSYNESKIAFFELINLRTTLQNFDCIDWHSIKQFNNYFNNEYFMQNLLDSFMHYCFEKDLNLDNIPWHFFAKTKPDFFNTYCEKLITCALKSQNTDKINDLMKRFPGKINRELINENCLIFLLPYTMAVKSTRNEICVTYKQECHKMITNCKSLFGTKFQSIIEDRSSFKNITESQCLSNLTEGLYDDNKFSELIGFKLHLNNIQYYFDFQQFHDIGQVLLETTNDEIFDEIFTVNPIEIIKYLKILKDNYHNSSFLWSQLLNLSRYYVALDMILPTLKKNLDSNVSEYFAKDILHFASDLMNNCKAEHNILFYAIIHFTERILLTLLDVPGIEKIFINTIMSVINCLEYYSENSRRLFRKCFVVLENVFCQIIEKSNVYLKLIEPLMKKNIFQNTNIGKYSPESIKVNSVYSSITNFIEQPNNLELDNLKSSIFENKAEFLNLIKTGNSKMFPKLLGKILNIVTDDKLDNALKATECLGLIGPIHIQKYAFTMTEEDNSIYQENWSGSFENFIQNTLIIVEKLLFGESYEPTKYKFIYSLCEVLLNYKKFCKTANVKFLDAFIQKSSKKSSYEFGLKKKINFVAFLQKNENLSYEVFLCDMMELIFDGMQFTEFKDLSKIQFGFSQAIIVPLTNYLLEISTDFRKFLIELLEYFFKEAANVILTSNSRKIYKNKKAIKCFLDLAECLRLANNWKLPINLLNVAKVATHQEAHFLAALYLELWAQNEIENSNFTKTNTELRENQEFQEIATRAFKAIGCIDDINCFLNPISARLDFYNNSNNWMDILIKLDATKSINDNSDLVADSLKQQGLFQLTKILKMQNNQPIDYEICWRLSEWDTIVKDDENDHFKDSLKSMEHQLEKFHFLTLKSIYEKDQTTALRSIKTARELIVNIFKESSIECIQNLYKILSNLMLLEHAEEFTKLQFPNDDGSNNIIQTFLNNWKLENTMKFGNYRDKDRVNAHRIILFESAGIRAKRKIQDFYNDDDMVADTLLHMINDCKINSNFDLTKRYLEKLKSIQNCSSEFLAKANLQDAEICWITNQKLIAKKILKNLMGMKEHKVVLQKIEAYHLYGKYLSETNDETFEDIYSKYLMESTKMTYKVREAINSKKLILNCINFNEFHCKMISKNYNLIAKHADNEYLLVDRHLSSERFKTTVRIKEVNEKDADKLKFKKFSSMEVAIHSELLQRNSKIDDKVINNFQKKHSEYLALAVEHYIKFSKYDDAVISPAIYRLISLWSTNKNNENLRKILDDTLMGIPSYKFICVLTQLTAHLNSKCSYFTETLEKLLFQMCIDHPHHSLTHIFSLKNAYLDDGNKTNKRDNRTEIAERIINKLRNRNECVALIEQLENMSVALIEFANVKVDPHKRKPKSITISPKIRNLVNLNKVHCPTKVIDIQRNKKYNIIHILNWSDQVKFAGGKNMPKRIFCKCSNGITYQQLLKGNDDLRQDAVMQQIFHFVNVLLVQNNDDCNLKLRTYEIKPLSKCSGILEWCINTIPIGDYLIGEEKNAGAHAQYYPDDLKAANCQMALREIKISDPIQRLKAFEEICSKFHPVFQYFFFEKYCSPGDLFEKRINYMTSLATSSMVGFILGLGDRHCQNILIDELTAEIVHIDFGIAFERGKTMPTPETVPFRLTRDMVAPMGICHLDGIFRKSCEITLKILRENHQPLLTILEVLLYDPLYCWTLNEKFNDESQACLALKNDEHDDEDDKEEMNAIAQRALIRVQTKLEGLEDMTVGSLSIENQVQKLIAEAMSMKNLSLLFHGWQPFC